MPRRTRQAVSKAAKEEVFEEPPKSRRGRKRGRPAQNEATEHENVNRPRRAAARAAEQAAAAAQIAEDDYAAIEKEEDEEMDMEESAQGAGDSKPVKPKKASPSKTAKRSRKAVEYEKDEEEDEDYAEDLEEDDDYEVDEDDDDDWNKPKRRRSGGKKTPPKSPSKKAKSSKTPPVPTRRSSRTSRKSREPVEDNEPEFEESPRKRSSRKAKSAAETKLAEAEADDSNERKTPDEMNDEPEKDAMEECPPEPEKPKETKVSTKKVNETENKKPDSVSKAEEKVEDQQKEVPKVEEKAGEKEAEEKKEKKEDDIADEEDDDDDDDDDEGKMQIDEEKVEESNEEKSNKKLEEKCEKVEEKSIDKTEEKPNDKAEEKMDDKPEKKPEEKIEKSDDKAESTEAKIEKPDDKSEKIEEKVEKSDDKAEITEEKIKKSDDKSDEKPSEKSAEKPKGRSDEKMDEEKPKSNDKEVEEKKEESIEKVEEKATENPKEKSDPESKSSNMDVDNDTSNKNEKSVEKTAEFSPVKEAENKVTTEKVECSSEKNGENSNQNDNEKEKEKEVSPKKHCNGDVQDPLSRSAIINSNAKQFDPKCQFSMVVYNLLAEFHASRGYLIWTTPDDLDQKNRHKLLMKELDYLNGDLLCLQEVDEEYFTNTLKPELAKQGYEGVHFARKQNYTEGCATFYRKSVFKLESEEKVHLEKAIAEQVEKNEQKSKIESAVTSPAVMIVMSLLHEPSGKSITIGNVHVDWANFTNKSLISVQSALAVRKSAKSPYHIVAGDFNAFPDTPAYQILTDGAPNEKSSNVLSGIKVEGDTSLLDLWKDGFKHSSENLYSSYKRVAEHEPELTNCNPDLWKEEMGKTTDYIWCSPLIETLNVLCVPQVKQIGCKIPNKQFASDHLSLKATLAFH